MTDIVVTVPARQWAAWLEEGDLPGQPWSGYDSHFWIARGRFPRIEPGERVYVVALGKVRGYAPFTGEMEYECRLNANRSCLIRRGAAVAVTVNCYAACNCAYDGPEHPAVVRGFQGWRYRWWPLYNEMPFPHWMNP